MKRNYIFKEAGILLIAAVLILSAVTVTANTLEVKNIAPLTRAVIFEDGFEKLPVELIYPDKSLIKNASSYKAHNALSYADCIAAATADSHSATLVTGDKEFIKLEKKIKIEWL